MSETKTTCPFCRRLPGEVHRRRCPRAVNRSTGQTRRELDELVLSMETWGTASHLRRTLAGEHGSARKKVIPHFGMLTVPWIYEDRVGAVADWVRRGKRGAGRRSRRRRDRAA